MESGLKAGPIKGVSEAREVLLAVPDDLRERLPKGARALAASVANEVAGAFPTVVAYVIPSSRGGVFGVYEVSAEAEVSTDDTPVGSVGGEGDQVPLFRVVVGGLNAVFADMGTENANAEEPRRLAALDYLNRTAGQPSRFAWPIAERAQARANRSLERTAKDCEKDYTDQLAEPSA